jgi:DNA mismatch repair protein MSH2
LYQCVAKLHQIIMELDSNEEFRNHANFHVLETSLLGPFRELTRQLSPFVQMIEDTIDFDALARNEYCLRPDFDSELQDISDEKNRVLDEMEPEFRRVCSLMKLEAGKKCKMEHNSVYGHYFRISRLDSARLSQLGNKGKGQDCGSEDDDVIGNGIGNVNSSSSYTELATLKSGIYFTTSKLTSLSRRYDSLSQEYLDKQASLVVGLLTASQPFRPVFTVLGTLFSMLDVLLALGHVAGTSVRCFVRPKFIDEGMRLCGARHACVEVQPGVSFIENDVEFDRSTGKVLQFITGPNMGGKSTYIRQTALIAILAQCGSFVPCSSAALPVFDAILVRVGAGDNITRGISTFMAEMLETATILQTATCSSLVVIDELGRGTSTCDGISLSRAISEHLANKVGCFTFFATHFHELTAMANQFPASISNLHVAVREDPTKANEALLLFKVQPGICDRSYGVHVARTVGFPDVVLKMAQWRADLLEGNRPAHLSPEESSFLEGGHVNDSIPPTLQKYFE